MESVEVGCLVEYEDGARYWEAGAVRYSASDDDPHTLVVEVVGVSGLVVGTERRAVSDAPAMLRMRYLPAPVVRAVADRCTFRGCGAPRCMTVGCRLQ